MPAWMTSELRELAWVPIASSASRITTSRPASASARATARPTTPAPITTASRRSTEELSFQEKGSRAGAGGEGGHGTRGTVEDGGEAAADDRAHAEADGADERNRGAGRAGKRRKRSGGGVRGGERGAREEGEKGQHHARPV